MQRQSLLPWALARRAQRRELRRRSFACGNLFPNTQEAGLSPPPCPAMPTGEMHSPSLSPVNTKRAPSCGPPSGPPSLLTTPRTARRNGDEEADQEGLEVHDWVRTVLTFLERNGPELLQAICTRYKIPYDRSIASIPIGTWEQVRRIATSLQLSLCAAVDVSPRCAVAQHVRASSTCCVRHRMLARPLPRPHLSPCG